MAQGSIESILPLAPIQNGIAFEALYGGSDGNAYTVQVATDMVGVVEPRLLREAVNAALRRHENLRSGFRPRPRTGETVQVVERDVAVPWTQLDVGGLDEAARAAEVDRLLAADAAARFDIARPPLLRAMLLSLGGDRHRLVLTYHQILLDGWSYEVLEREIFAIYAARGDAGGLPEPTPYRRYLEWIAGRDVAGSKAAWREYLAGVTEPTLVATPIPGRTASESGRVELTMGSEFTADLQRLARSHALTLNSLLQGAWGLVVGQLQGAADIVFGVTVNGRPPEIPGAETMVGIFANIVPLRMRLAADEQLLQTCARIQREQARMSRHHFVGLSEIQQIAGHRELFDAIMAFQNFPNAVDIHEELDTLRIEEASGWSATHYSLEFIAFVRDGRLTLRIDHAADLFTRPQVEEQAKAVERVLRTVVGDPAVTIGRLDLVSPAEFKAVVVDRNDTARAVSGELLPEIFERRAGQAPDDIALVCDGVEISYGEVNARANRLARLLVAKGVGPEQIVGLVLPRSERYVVAMLAVLKAGGAYLPIDPEYPAERISFVVRDARPRLLLTVRSLSEGLRATGVDLVTLDGDEVAGELARNADVDLVDADRTGPLDTAQTAYVIYTSGSTGRPKGVVVTHQGVPNLAADFTARFGLDGGSRLLQFASPSFDASVAEMWPIWWAGGRLVLASPQRLAMGRPLIELMTGQAVTHVILPPAVLPTLAAEGGLPPEITLMTAGEKCSGELALEWSRGRRMINAYGPTEATVAASASAPLSGAETPSIGGPIANVRLYVLDRRLRPVPTGVAGELYIAGVGLARGYLGRPGPTSERFVANPYEVGERMYRTGDLVRWRPDGSLDFLGRVDRQLKIRGFRIEPGEVEAVLSGHPGVSQVAVASRGGDDDARLVAYVVPTTQPDGQPDIRELRSKCERQLPAFMVPSAFTVLPELPLTPSGKIDFGSLGTAEPAVPNSERRRPLLPREELMCGLFMEVLGVDAIGLDDDFFELGGHSLLATRLVSRVRAELGVQLSMRGLFRFSTVTSLLAGIESGECLETAARPALRRRVASD